MVLLNSVKVDGFITTETIDRKFLSAYMPMLINRALTVLMKDGSKIDLGRATSINAVLSKTQNLKNIQSLYYVV